MGVVCQFQQPNKKLYGRSTVTKEQVLKCFVIEMSSEELPVVTSLNLFPIKSCQAQCVQEFQLDEYGVMDDRRLMVVDGNGRFISQRRFPVLATVTACYEVENGKKLMCVSAPSMSENLKFQPVLIGQRVECSVWESKVWVVDQGDTPASWFSQLIWQSGFYRLVACAEQNQSFARNVENLPPQLKQRLPPMKIGLADAGPVSLVSQESLADLNKRMRDVYEKEVPLNRFRMNIEVRGCTLAFEEDDWLLVRIGSVPFLVYTNAERCKMTAVDQITGTVDKLGPLEVLRSYRAPRGPAHAMFGQLLIPLQTGSVRLGDTVQVLERKKR